MTCFFICISSMNTAIVSIRATTNSILLPCYALCFLCAWRCTVCSFGSLDTYLINCFISSWARRSRNKNERVEGSYHEKVV